MASACHNDPTLQGIARAGRQRMRSARVVFCALARELGPVLTRTIGRIERTASAFLDYRVIVVENDSRDLTRPRLRQWAYANPRVHLITMNLGSRRFGPTRERERTELLTHCREKYHAYVREHYGYADYVIVLDTDLNAGWCHAGLETSFAHSEWGAIASNGLVFVPVRYEGRVLAHRQVHYDSWAFRLRSHPEAMKNRPINALNMAPGPHLVPVLSAFGGLAVYTMAAFLSSRYYGDDCEHVPFHAGMRMMGHAVFLNPNQLVFYNAPPLRELIVTGAPMPAIRGDEMIRQHYA